MITMQNSMRIQVPPAAVSETRQVLDEMPNTLKLTRINEVEGWLEIELLPASKRNSVNPYQVNRILSVLIRAKIPIISFGPEEEHLQEMSVNLATDIIR
jgi:hypothetical protein